MFAEAGAAVWCADDAVARLYGPDGAGTEEIARLAPEAAGPKGVDRTVLRKLALSNPNLLKKIESKIHPLVRDDRIDFLSRADARGSKVAICDIPLLYETGAEKEFDAVVVVSAPADIQRERVLARPGMTEQALEAILVRQTPDAEKRARADYVIDTGEGLESARVQVAAVMAAARDRNGKI
jgi:dephospho-CoA kinase